MPQTGHNLKRSKQRPRLLSPILKSPRRVVVSVFIAAFPAAIREIAAYPRNL